MSMQDRFRPVWDWPAPAVHRNKSARLNPRPEITPRWRKSRRDQPSQRKPDRSESLFILLRDYVGRCTGLMVEGKFTAIQERPEQILELVLFRVGPGQALLPMPPFPAGRRPADDPQI